MKQSRIDDVERAKGLLTQAMSLMTQAMPDDRNVQDARARIRQALNDLDKATKRHAGRKSEANRHKEWWGNVTSGVAAVAESPMSPQAAMRSLDTLNRMMAEEQQKIDEIEKKAEQTVVLND